MVEDDTEAHNNIVAGRKGLSRRKGVLSLSVFVGGEGVVSGSVGRQGVPQGNWRVRRTEGVAIGNGGKNEGTLPPKKRPKDHAGGMARKIRARRPLIGEEKAGKAPGFNGCGDRESLARRDTYAERFWCFLLSVGDYFSEGTMKKFVSSRKLTEL